MKLVRGALYFLFVGLFVIGGFYTWVVYGRLDTVYASGYSERAFGRISPGMTKKDVVALIGEPLSTTEHSDEERWYYSEQSTDSRSNYYIRNVVFDMSGNVIGTVSELEID